MAGNIYPGQTYAGGQSSQGGELVPTFESVRTNYLYKIYDKDWNYLGTWNDVVSDFTYSQEINSAGSAIDVILARNSDSLETSYDSVSSDNNGPIITDDSNEIAAEISTTNSIGSGTTIDLNLNVRIYEFSKDTTSIEGDLVFTGYISKYTSQYGSEEQTKVSIFSYGADLDNHLLIDTDNNTRVSYQSKDPAAILTDALDKFQDDGGLITYTQGLPVYSDIINLVKNPSFEVSDNGWTVAYGYGGRVDWDSWNGSYAMYVHVAAGGMVLGNSITPNLVQGKQYTFSFYGKKSGGSAAQVEVSHGGGQVLSFSVDASSWTRYSGTFVATANDSIGVSLMKSGTDTQGWIDGLMLTEGTSLYTYFDGNTTSLDPDVSYVWDGTSGLSTSRQRTLLSYSGGTVKYTDTLITYIFNLNTTYEVIKKCLELAPNGWFFYTDLATNQLYFQPRPTEPKHFFYLGKHILSLNLEKSMEGIVNDLVLTGGRPSVIIRDLFSGVNGTELSSHTGELEASWTKVSWSGNTSGQAVLQSGRLRSNSANAVTYVASGQSLSNDYSVSGDLRVLTNDGSKMELLGRVQSTSVMTCYMARLDTAANQAQLYKFVNGTATLIGSKAFTIATNRTYSLRLSMEGKRISFQIDNDTICDIDDTSIPDGILSGVRVQGAVSNIATGHQLNNFKVELASFSGPGVFKRYIDQDSINDYRRGLSRLQDNRVTSESSADAIALSHINEFKEPRYTSEITITAATYPIRTIKPGDVIAFRNFGNFIDEVKMQVVRINYNADEVSLALDTLPPSVPKRIEDLRRNLNQADVNDNPDSTGDPTVL